MKKITTSLLLIMLLTACDSETTVNNNVIAPKENNSAPGAPGNKPYWAYAGKTGIGTSYEQYQHGKYDDLAATGKVSKVWFSIAQGIVTETMFGLIHQAQLNELQFVIKGEGFVATELHDTTSTIEYLYKDEQGRPLSLAYKVVNTDKLNRFVIEKHIFTDPEQQTLFIRSKFIAKQANLTAYVYANPYVANNGIGDRALVEGNQLIAWQDEHFVTLTAKNNFAAKSVGFVGVSDGLTDLQDNNLLDHQYSNTGEQTGNVAFLAELGKIEATSTFDIVLGFGYSKESSMLAAAETLKTGYQQVLNNYNGIGEYIGWQDYLASLADLPRLQHSATDSGKLLNTSAMVLKAQEDKTYAGALIASLSNPWGDTVPALKSHTGYKAVWVRDFYQVAMAFMALGDFDTAKTAFNYLKKVQVTPQLKENKGDTGWFLQKTHVDGQIEWVGVQLDQTAMPIMLAWKLWQAGQLSNNELNFHYQGMLKSAADFLVTGGNAIIDWNNVAVIPPYTQQERWEEQEGFSPSTIAAVIAGLVTAADIAESVGDKESADKYIKQVKTYSQQVEKIMFTETGIHGDGKYYLRISPDLDPNSDKKILTNNGRVGMNKKAILDAGFLELVRYGVRQADDSAILASLPELDSQTLDENLKIKYSFNYPNVDGDFPGWRRYGNDGYGEDEILGTNYSENGDHSAHQRGRVWPIFTGERAHYELAKLLQNQAVDINEQLEGLKNTYVKALELFANEGMMLPEQIWDGVGVNPRGYELGEGTNSATPLAWSHAEYVKLIRSVSDKAVWDHYDLIEKELNE